MSKETVRSLIKAEKANARSTDEQIEIAHAMWDHNIGPQHEGLKRAEIEDRLDLDLEYRAATSLDHLVDIKIVEEFTRPGPDTYVIADWRDGDDAFIMDEVTEAAEQGIEALIEHMREDDPFEGDDAPAVADGAGLTLRSLLADAFDYEPQAVEEQLRTGDPVDKLNNAVEVIEESEDFEPRDDYGEVVFINPAHRYRLTERAVRLYEEEE